ncbi:hypothetical protein [Nissabacter sp. SGAir0207]|uniref:hypothetical protein n=1 Tax=Nissabacter sp. SGAir0207 TaxID=2126321 RepID=UPI0010CCB165|nr:hypothetical protein [Nissabacter sp. SGAir0207]QCR38740.1 hypothetical protein C1N62_21645 [Nissabacter sp. SGAir0207]
MLSTPAQIAAYQALKTAGGLATAASATQSTQAAKLATKASATLSGLVLSTVTYPSSINANVAQISSWAKVLAGTATQATSHATLLANYSDPSTLIQLTTGWDVHCRASGLKASELAISTAIGDAATPGALVAALTALDISALSSAMDSINATLASGTATVPAALSTSQVAALQTAVTGFTAKMATATAAQKTLATQYDAASSSITTSQQAYSNAISVALIGASINSAAVAKAVSAITPASVLALLKESA